MIADDADPDIAASIGMRSLYDRMTNPTPEEMDVSVRLQRLSYVEIDRVVSQFGMMLDHLAAQRQDITVQQSRDKDGWTIRVNIKPVTQSAINFNGNA